MRRERPTSMLVMGILNICFGSLGLICNVCGGLSLLVIFGVKMPGASEVFDDEFKFLNDKIPGFTAISIAQIVIGLGLYLILVMAGVGLISMQSWARWASVFWSVVVIFMTIGNTAFQLFLVGPATHEWQEQYLAKHKLAGGPAASGAGSEVMSSVGTVFGAVLVLSYAVVLLVMMLLPSVSAAFAGQPVRQRGYDPYDEEDDWPRRRSKWDQE